MPDVHFRCSECGKYSLFRIANSPRADADVREGRIATTSTIPLPEKYPTGRGSLLPRVVRIFSVRGIFG
jgi:hypothetical protein